MCTLGLEEGLDHGECRVVETLGEQHLITRDLVGLAPLRHLLPRGQVRRRRFDVRQIGERLAELSEAVGEARVGFAARSLNALWRDR